jgi:hypothetical protein
MLAMAPPIQLPAVIFISFLGAFFAWMLVSRALIAQSFPLFLLAAATGVLVNVAFPDGRGLIAFLTAFVTGKTLFRRVLRNRTPEPCHRDY